VTLDRVFEALSSTVRRKILAYLSATDLTAGEIAARFEISKPSVSKHLSVLENAGLVTSRRTDSSSITVSCARTWSIR
jgi:DNA-binding transcriptional ArsR family regulator